MARLKVYLLQVLIAFDQLVNALAGGWADETISARSYRMQGASKKWKVIKVLIDTLFFFDKDHCHASYLSEQKRLHIAPEYRD